MNTHPLDNVIWSALTTHQKALASGGALAKSFDPHFARFAALAEPSPEAFAALAQLVPAGKEVALFTVQKLTPGERFEVSVERDMLQMMRNESRLDAAPANAFRELGPSDLPEMAALVEKTKPGPFCERTNELGRFIGIRVDGRLAAMVGQRMHVDGFTEISAVCADPDFRGRGLVQTLMVEIARGIEARGERSILHVFPDNHSAVGLYRKLGFEKRAELRLTVLKRKPEA